jgi:anion-transporting  ArsA/GET3 family ATPase
MIHLISGKGGVGKSSVAAALAWRLAAEGRRTLLVELGERSYFRYVFQNDADIHSVQITTHLGLARWDGEACLREYLAYLLKIERVVKLFFDNKIMRALVQAAPALRELAVLGKVTSGARRVGPSLPYDELVVDGYATGHFRALWRAPVGLAEAIPFGPMGEQSRSIVRVLKDPALTRFYVVAIPEELPVVEGLELARDIQAEMEQRPRLVLNRWLESPLDSAQLSKFRGQEFADYLTVVLERQSAMREAMAARGLPLTVLPWLFADGAPEKVRQLSTHFSDLFTSEREQ